MLFADAFLGKFFKNCSQRNKKKTTQDARQCMEYEIFESLHILKLHVHTAPRRQLEVSLCFWGEFKKRKKKKQIITTLNSSCMWCFLIVQGKKFLVIQWKLLSETEENKAQCMLNEYQISVLLLLFKNIKSLVKTTTKNNISFSSITSSKNWETNPAKGFIQWS